MAHQLTVRDMLKLCQLYKIIYINILTGIQWAKMQANSAESRGGEEVFA